MGYEIRTLATLADQARQSFTQSISGAMVRFWANTFTVLGKVFALLDFEHELRRQWLFNQLFASTAEQAWLTRHGYELGMTQDPGNAAAGTITATCAAGLAIPAGLQFARADGLTYTTLAAVTPTGTTAVLALQADDVGAVANTEAGDTLTIIDPATLPAGMGAIVTVAAAGLTGGTDPEALESFRARILYRKRNPPQGGSIADYVEWAEEALSTVNAVFVDSFQNDARSVWVCFTVSDQASGIPSDGEVATLQGYLDDPVRRPVTARVFVVPPRARVVPVTIANLLPNTPEVQASIEAELAALQLDAIKPSTPSTPFVLYREQIEAAIARASGVAHFTLNAPAADLTYPTAADMPVLSTPTYV